MSELELNRLEGRTGGKVANSLLKRVFDLALSSAALIVLAPTLLLIGLMVYLETGGPVFFVQTRTGLGGRPFKIYKFRSMTVAEDHGDIRQAEKNDARVTRVGAYLRALSLDELPQLINVLKGDMSLVGPRPHAVSHDSAWGSTVPGYERRFRTRPGLTGYAQVQGHRGEVRCLDDVKARVEADNAYIDNWSVGMEAAILLRTVPLLFNDPQAY